MKKFLAVLILTLVSCTKLQKEYTTKTYYNTNYTLELVDSILKVENVDWIDSFPLRGSEVNYYEYYYYRDSLILRFIKNGDSIKVTKRINL